MLISQTRLGMLRPVDLGIAALKQSLTAKLSGARQRLPLCRKVFREDVESTLALSWHRSTCMQYETLPGVIMCCPASDIMHSGLKQVYCHCLSATLKHKGFKHCLNHTFLDTSDLEGLDEKAINCLLTAQCITYASG